MKTEISKLKEENNKLRISRDKDLNTIALLNVDKAKNKGLGDAFVEIQKKLNITKCYIQYLTEQKVVNELKTLKSIETLSHQYKEQLKTQVALKITQIYIHNQKLQAQLLYMEKEKIQIEQKIRNKLNDNEKVLTQKFQLEMNQKINDNEKVLTQKFQLEMNQEINDNEKVLTQKYQLEMNQKINDNEKVLTQKYQLEKIQMEQKINKLNEEIQIWKHWMKINEDVSDKSCNQIGNQEEKNISDKSCNQIGNQEEKNISDKSCNQIGNQEEKNISDNGPFKGEIIWVEWEEDRAMQCKIMNDGRLSFLGYNGTFILDIQKWSYKASDLIDIEKYNNFIRTCNKYNEILGQVYIAVETNIKGEERYVEREPSTYTYGIVFHKNQGKLTINNQYCGSLYIKENNIYFQDVYSIVYKCINYQFNKKTNSTRIKNMSRNILEFVGMHWSNIQKKECKYLWFIGQTDSAAQRRNQYVWSANLGLGNVKKRKMMK